MVSVQNISLYKTEERRILVTVTIPAGTPKNLTNAVITYVVNNADGTEFFRKEGADITIEDAVNGVFSFLLDGPVDFADIISTYVFPHYCVVIDFTSIMDTVFTGYLKVIVL